MTGLRVGGPCVVEEHRYIFSSSNGHMGYFYEFYPDAECEREMHEITPAPFIPGDVVGSPEAATMRGLVIYVSDDLMKICWENGVRESIIPGSGFYETLTLILPAQGETR